MWGQFNTLKQKIVQHQNILANNRLFASNRARDKFCVVLNALFFQTKINFIVVSRKWLIQIRQGVHKLLLQLLSTKTLLQNSHSTYCMLR